MKVCIILFSPSGHTRTVAEQLRKELTNKAVKTQLLDVTGVNEIQNENKISRYLEKHVEEHDILFVGAPVYAGHFESNMIRIIKNLPAVNEKWGRGAVPFVTYGGLHSSIALLEAGELLLETGRVNVGGIKIAAFHTLTTKSDKKINSEKPGKEEFAIINEFINTLLSKDSNILLAKDISTQFDYIPEEEKQLYLSKSQDDWHQPYRNVTIDSDKCSK